MDGEPGIDNRGDPGGREVDEFSMGGVRQGPELDQSPAGKTIGGRTEITHTGATHATQMPPT